MLYSTRNGRFKNGLFVVFESLISERKILPLVDPEGESTVIEGNILCYLNEIVNRPLYVDLCILYNLILSKKLH